MSRQEEATRLAVAERAAVAGGGVAEEAFRTGIDVETKGGKTDVVTAADRDAQRRVVDVVGASYPDDPVVGEEEGTLDAVPESGPAWVVDPIDGTNNFVRNIRVWATAVAYVEDGDSVAAATAMPAVGDTYTADATTAYRDGREIAVSDESDPEKATVCPTIWWDMDRRDEYAAACEAIVSRFGDMRRFGCAQAMLAMVADGSIEGVITNLRANPWDSIAGVHLVRRAGGTVTDLSGDPWRHDSVGLVASNGRLHDDVLAAAREIDAETGGEL